MNDGEKSLAAAVVLRAVEDARATKPNPPTNQTAKRMTSYRKRLLDWRRDRDEARNFLTAESGGWREMREFWCELAGMSPEMIRTKSLEPVA